MIRLDRSRRDPDIWLGEKMIFFATGAALGLAGMVTGRDWLIWVAIVVLGIGFALRLFSRRTAPAATPDHAERDSGRPLEDEEQQQEEPEEERPDGREQR
jgi:hypothetical protein